MSDSLKFPKTTTWIYGRPDPDILDPTCWTNGVPVDGDKVIVPGRVTECFPHVGCKNGWALKGITINTFVDKGGGINMPGTKIVASGGH